MRQMHTVREDKLILEGTPSKSKIIPQACKICIDQRQLHKYCIFLNKPPGGGGGGHLFE